MRDDPFAELPDSAALRAALARPFRRAIRVHPRRGSPSGWGELAPVPWTPAGRFHPDAVDPGSRLDYHTGCAYPQDASSQLPVVLLDPPQAVRSRAEEAVSTPRVSSPRRRAERELVMRM